MIKPEHLSYAIRAILKLLVVLTDHPLLDSKAARQLLFITSLVESDGGYYIYQEPSRIAKGLTQVEKIRVDDVYSRLKTFDNRPLYQGFKKSLDALYISSLNIDQNFMLNLAYAIAFTRIAYYLVPEDLPKFNDRKAMWEYYKKWWNSSAGATTKEKFYSCWSQMEFFKLEFEG
jgi:hypothetical protein